MDSSVKAEKITPAEVRDRILALTKGKGNEGISDKALQSLVPEIPNGDRAKAINDLLSSGKVQLFQSSQGILIKVKEAQDTTASNQASVKGGDAEEKIVFSIIQESGNKGTWIRDIRLKSNLIQTTLNKVLKSLETKKLIKAIKSVNATKKKVYMLYDLDPDVSVTGGAWYSNQDFETEFVEILNQQCFRYLYTKLEKSKDCPSGPVAGKHASCASSDDLLKYISELGISKISLKLNDIEMILDTLIYDGKIENVASEDSKKYYRATESLLPPTGLVRVPCGICPVIKDCKKSLGSINPKKCTYMKEWFEI
ncbi:DNA-directed RNA polymerase III subunit RPC6 [Lepeophtheirus salmonis]|uniref:DNA-directed RNA polymerase III subunit RPC6 n=1 Tax=Lepeophtheirus salmonis TaxID=72036 RepID=UPI001AE8452F|nr:DNA-directed RNA polymerase III subunit RPC6-like [Lepeophtheirus salmonis]